MSILNKIELCLIEHNYDLYLTEYQIDTSKINRGKRQTLKDYLEQLNILNKKSKDAGKTMSKLIARNNTIMK